MGPSESAAETLTGWSYRRRRESKSWKKQQSTNL